MAEIIIDQGSVRDRNTIELATSQGRRIPNARRPESLATVLAEGKKMVLDNHPSARLRSLTARCNCIGMAFANRRTWIEPTHVPMILDDDGYREVSVKDVMPGDIVVYLDKDREISHVAVVVSHEPDLANYTWKTTVLSQWGADGEYLHDHLDVNPLLGKPDKFYSERRIPG
jgi:hypothetical protein